MAWKRVLGVIAAALIGVGGGLSIWLDPHASRTAISASGILLVVGGAAAALLLLILYIWIAEDVRPGVFARRPPAPLRLTTELGALIGKRRFRAHPVRFWTGLTLNHRFFVGFMVFAKSEELDFHEDRPSPSTKAETHE